ncbi:hypothetical protein L422_03438 [Enterobacter hormaechei]|nr:hypothetical protein L422_03438 [Enterobacter hormaechei]
MIQTRGRPVTFLSCLYGSARFINKLMSKADFLSCLYGSALCPNGIVAVAVFLSCLYGSAHSQLQGCVTQHFLSCLYGSALRSVALRSVIIFLSCLYGSAPRRLRTSASHEFLSCLYGSAPYRSTDYPIHYFLSCLYGSAHPAGQRNECQIFSKLPVRQCTEIISLHHHDFHTKKAKISAQTLFLRYRIFYRKINALHFGQKLGSTPILLLPHPEQKTPVPYPLTNGYTYS